jgi:hypothetical protein
MRYSDQMDRLIFSLLIVSLMYEAFPALQLPHIHLVSWSPQYA